MDFKITPHSGWEAPDNALDLLWEQLGKRRGQTSFVRGRNEIRATWGEDLPVGMEASEREELGRNAILEIVYAVCDGAPDLRPDWYAVGARR
jgi:hypothetical protein